MTRIDFISAVAAGILLLTGAAAAQVGKNPDGFIPVFDGKTVKGWHVSRTTRHGSTRHIFVE